jgi:hypothetical protein
MKAQADHKIRMSKNLARIRHYFVDSAQGERAGRVFLVVQVVFATWHTVKEFARKNSALTITSFNEWDITLFGDSQIPCGLRIIVAEIIRSSAWRILDSSRDRRLPVYARATLIEAWKRPKRTKIRL